MGIVNGASTLLENWDLKAERDISDNHMMFGAVGGWFFRGLGGIYPDSSKPGFKNIVLRPNFVTGLQQFTATHQSSYGLIESKWEKKIKDVVYKVIILANSMADLYIPDGFKLKKVKLDTGKEISCEKTSEQTYRLLAGNYIMELGNAR